jgi:hypothetical protein
MMIKFQFFCLDVYFEFWTQLEMYRMCHQFLLSNVNVGARYRSRSKEFSSLYTVLCVCGG